MTEKKTKKDYDPVAEKLNASVPAECVSERKGLSYITGRYVKDTLNAIFGWSGWSYEVIQQYKVETESDEVVQWFAHVRLTVYHGVEKIVRDGLAVGHGTLKKANGEYVTPGRENEVTDFAAAEAVTDALKRAAVSLGNALGLELYPLTSDKKTAGRKRTAKTPTTRKRTTTKRKPAAKKTTSDEADEQPEDTEDTEPKQTKKSGVKRAKKF